jgi:large subunit ribosomal protein L19
MHTSILEKLHHEQITRPVDAHVGDTVKVHYRIKEGNKERIQVYEGVVIAIRNSGAGKSIVVRRISYDVGVERIFPVYSPTVEKIEKVRSSKVRRAKLYFQRGRAGKKGRLTEIKKTAKIDSVFAKVDKKRQEVAAAAPAAEPAGDAQPAPVENATE